MTTPISSSPAASAIPTAAAGSAATDKTKMDKDMFLKLLIAQLKYQDPMKPTDATAFMAQTAQMTVVEKLDELTKSNAELLSSNRALSASSLIGRSIVYSDGAGEPKTATVTGVRLEASGPVLLAGATSIALGAVREVRPAGTEAATAAGTAAGAVPPPA